VLTALACGVCEFLWIDYGEPELARYLLILTALVFCGTLFTIILERLTWSTAFRHLAFVFVAGIAALVLYGTLTFSGAVLIFLGACGYVTRKAWHDRREPRVMRFIWTVVFVATLAAVPLCVWLNGEVLSCQPARMASALEKGQVTSKRAEADLKRVPKSPMRATLAHELETALVAPVEGGAQKACRERIVSVLVAWHEAGALDAIREARARGLLRPSLADSAIAALKVGSDKCLEER
jgi:hypothetical protein